MPIAAIHNTIFRAAFCALSLTLIACQALRQQPFASGTQQARYLHQQTQWQATGKIAFTLEGERHNASFQWQQNRQDFQIHLFGPFGQGSTWLRKAGDLVTLESTAGEARQALSAEQLMQDNLGWQVPVSDMRYWIRGLAAPNSPSQDQLTDDKGFYQELKQQGWQVNYREYQQYRGWWLPQKLVATRDGIRLLVVIKQWQMAPPPRSK